VQIKQSHDLALVKADVGTAGVSAVVPEFDEMLPGDNLTIRWRGFYGGDAEDEWTATLPLDEVAIELTPLVYIPRTEILFSDEADVSYDLEHGDGSVIHSPVQRFQIGAPGSARLDAPDIEGHDASKPIDPGRYPDGIVVQVAAYPGMQPGDYVVLYADGAAAEANVVKTHQVQQVAVLEFSIGPEWLLANQGAEVTLMYQYARPGAGKTSAPLVLTVLKPLDLQPPIIERATAEGEAWEHKGLLQAGLTLSGVYVRVPDWEPDSLPLRADDQLEVHWHGDPAGGQYIATSPVAGDLKRFVIPATAVAANMGGEDKRFNVFYRFTPLGSNFQDSKPFRLRIEPLPRGHYPIIQWVRIGTTLSLKTVPAAGEEVLLDEWPFMAQGQLVTIEATGVTAAGGAAQTFVRQALPVTLAEATARKISGRVPLAFLRTLKLYESITLKVHVSFDGGQSSTSFYSNSSVQLID
jgi:hypothetical protein